MASRNSHDGGDGGQGAPGGQLLLRLSEQSDVAVVYAAELTGDGDAIRGEARVELKQGEVRFGWDAEPAPDWLIDATRAVLRTLWRARNKSGGADESRELEPWPRRIKRWRVAPQQPQTP